MGRDLVSLGLVVAGALILGKFVSRFGVPRVTGYLLAGALLGPSVADLLGIPALVSHHSLDDFHALSETALALIVFAVGGQFHFSVLRRWKRRVAVLMLADAVIPFLFVGLATRLAGTTSDVAIMLGIIAAATAPAATVMVIRECDAEGEVSQLMGALLGFTNFLAIVVFQLVAHFIVTPHEPALHVVKVLGLPIVIGLLAGGVIAFWEQRMDSAEDRQVLGIGAITLMAGAAYMLHVSVLLTSLVAGIVVANAAPHERRLFDDLHEIDYPFYVPFFVLAGARLHLNLLVNIGLVGAAYVLARAAGKVIGDGLGAKLGKFGQPTRRWLGMGMLAQAGVAVGFASQLRRTWGHTGHEVEALVLSSVLVFEVIGPILARQSLLRSGEVAVLTLLTRRAPVGVFEGVHQVIGSFRDSLGIPASHKLDRPRDVFVKHVMRRSSESILDTASFNEVLHALRHSRYDRLPVLDKDGKYIGQLRYGDIANVLFEPSLSGLVLARDLAVPDEQVVLREDQTLDDAFKLFSAHQDVTYVPVLSDDNVHLMGIVRQNDVLAACRKL